MTNYKAKAHLLFDAMKDTPAFQKMARTVEGSPWHREANVLVHTEMVLNDYCRRVGLIKADDEWTRDDYLGAVECIFHDIGKPPAEIEKYSETRGKYRAYHGHELLSARLFEDYAANKYSGFTAEEISRISWMIEYHMPWKIEDKEKLESIGYTSKLYGHDVYTRSLLADQYGRTSDDWDINTARSDKWVEDFNVIVENLSPRSVNLQAPHAVFPIAPSGAGKSTYLKQLRDKAKEAGVEVVVFSLDLLRHEFYHPTDYNKAFQGSVEDKSFESRANARFHAMAKQAAEDNAILYVDNTNLSAKRRGWYLRVLKKHGFFTEAVLMPIKLQTLIDRQKTRGDKVVPEAAVRQQYKSLQMPLIGEFDKITTSNHNMV